MSKENAIKFEEKQKNDEAFRARVAEAARAYGEDRSSEKAFFEDVIAPIAKEEGLEFTFEEVAEVNMEVQEGELDMSELKAFTGGSYNCGQFATYAGNHRLRCNESGLYF